MPTTYPAVYRARAVKYEPPVVTALVPQVFGQTAIEIIDAIGTPATGMGWVFFQGGNPEFPVWTSGLGGGGGGNGGGGGGTVTDVLHVGANVPTAADMELWYDTDEVPGFASSTDHWNTAWGVVAQFPRLGSVPIGTIAAITGNLSWTFQSGRRYRVVAYIRAIGTTAPATFQLTLYDGAGALTQYGSNSHSYTQGNYGDVNVQWFIDGTGQTHTALNFKATGAGQTAYMDAPSQCYIEDIGPVTRLASETPPPEGYDWSPWDARYSALAQTEVTSASLAFAAGFEDYLTNYGPCKLTKVGPMVVCQGLVKRSIGQAAFTSGTFATVPAGFRPTSGNQLFTTMVSTPSLARIDVIYTTGVMSLYSSPAVSVAAGGWIGINVTWVVT